MHTAAQLNSDLLAMAPLNQPTMKKGHQMIYHPQANQTEMNFYKGSGSKQGASKFVVNHKQLGYNPEQLNLPNMPGQAHQVQNSRFA